MKTSEQRYGMDFNLMFCVRTDNPDPNGVQAEDVVQALRERVSDLLKTDPENVLAEVWPPAVFDYDAGTMPARRLK